MIPDDHLIEWQQRELLGRVVYSVLGLPTIWSKALRGLGMYIHLLCTCASLQENQMAPVASTVGCRYFLTHVYYSWVFIVKQISIEGKHGRPGNVYVASLYSSHF